MKKMLSLALVATVGFALMFVACKKDPDPVKTTGIEVQKGNPVFLANQDIILNANVLPTNADNKNLIWTFRDTTLLSMFEVTNGKVTVIDTAGAVSKGTIRVVMDVTTEEGGFTDTAVATIVATCGGPDPNGFDLGTVSFLTDTVTEIGDLIWSDDVKATGCDGKTIPYMGLSANYNPIGCRTSPAPLGYHFSYCAMMRNRDKLCPGDWRLPTIEEYQELLKALGGTGESQPATEDVRVITQKLTNAWRGRRSGWSQMGMVTANETTAQYWSASSNERNAGSILNFTDNATIGLITINHTAAQIGGSGYAVRCVKNK